MFLNDSLATIKSQILKYSYYTSGHNKILKPTNEIINKQFCQWMNKLVNQDYTLRMYTLNYDRAFKILLQTSGLEVFEGFNLNGTAVDYNQSIPPNLPRIISDFDSHIHYNLHGSAYWNLKILNSNGLSGYEFHLVPSGEIDAPAGTITFEKGKRLLLSSIITGYQKVQRTATSPFRQMFSAFDRDCFEVGRLYIVGYSFGDEHINDIVRNARKYNNKLEIVLIDPNFDENKFYTEFILHWGTPTMPPYQDAGPKEIVSNEFNVRIIKEKFGDFLQERSFD